MLKERLLALLAAMTLATSCAFCQSSSISMAGSWAIRLDPAGVGEQERWAERELSPSDIIFLPGSTDQAGLGTRTKGTEKDRLSRVFTYEGAAWYEREVIVPEAWRGKRIRLFLERPHWETRLWVDGKACGTENSLSTPHVHQLPAGLAPGRHRLTLCVDNRYKIEVGRGAHSVTDWTQTNWNGVVGRIELRAGERVWIESAQAYPDLKEKSVRIEVLVRNSTGRPVDVKLDAAAGVARASAQLAQVEAERVASLTLPLGDRARLWDEYVPELTGIDLSLSTGDRQRVSLGVRSIGAREKQIVLNGRPVFLRGTVECAIFPKTGFPPTDVESWARLFRIARSYGLNHFRFHSWCPPEAAFTAADEAGFLLHVELPVWSKRVGLDPVLGEYMRQEGRRILKSYGNHPSFAMLCLGNELNGDYKFMDQLVTEFKALDPRHLYTFAADYQRFGAGPVSDYYVSQRTKAGLLRVHGRRFTKTAPETLDDYSASVAEIDVPLVAHELGQWVTYPSFEEIAKYTGVLKPRNLEVFRSTLAAREMLDQAEAFQHATGCFAWQFYKEDIETALRTPHFGGVQLLQLHDFPGQGEALIGLLDSFWDSKGILTPAESRRFFNRTVPLLRMPKRVWNNQEAFTATAQVAHYGIQVLRGASGRWSARDDAGRERGAGRFAAHDVPLGSVTTLGEIRMPLAGISQAARLKVTVQVEGAAARNDWDIWVYPAQAAEPPSRDALVTSVFDDAARRKLQDGGKVVLFRPRDASNDHTLATQFQPVFWSFSYFPKQTGVMGILCDPKHAALADFPTDGHSNWQWWELMEGSRAFVLDDAPAGLRPIVQVIDDYHRNHRLGAVFEASVGAGKLLVCSLDVEHDLDSRPVARQLRRSLLAYVASAAFHPTQELSVELLSKMLGR